MHINYTDYKIARDMSWQVLIAVKADCLPIRLSVIAKFYGIQILSYAHTNIVAPSDDGFSLKKDGRCIIYYNEKKPLHRQRFTIAHELGHCLLGHLKDIDQTFCRNTESDVSDPMEQQANVFARDVLMPAIVLHSLGVNSAGEIAKLCNVSMQSAEIRWKRLQELNTRNKFNLCYLEKQVCNNFKEYIKQGGS
jgi:Zn-dependent peptidase ImmA (M78 family)